MPRLTLRDFLVPVPPWEHRQTLMDCLTGGSETIQNCWVQGWVVVNGHHHPLAWVATRQLLKSLAASLANPQEDDSAQGLLALAIAELPPPLLQPLPHLAADWDLHLAWSRLQTEFSPLGLLDLSSSANPPWAIVDGQGRYLGILNLPALLSHVHSVGATPVTPVLNRWGGGDLAANQPAGQPALVGQDAPQDTPAPILEIATTANFLNPMPAGQIGLEPASLELLQAQLQPNMAALLSQLLLAQQQVAALQQRQQQHQEFLATLSHELKTPLTAILGLTTVLGNPGLGTLNPRQSKYVQVLQETGRKMMGLIQDLLDLAQIDLNRLLINSELVELAPLCEKVMTQVRAEVDPNLRHASPLQVDIAPDLETIIADGFRLRQILSNLLTLTFQALQPSHPEANPEIADQVHQFPRLQVWQWPGWVCWQVHIPPGSQVLDQHTFIFEELLNLSAPNLPAAGLGLKLAWRLAQLQGGDLSFWSLPQLGSEFTLLLPQPLAIPSRTSPSKTSVPAIPRKVLIASRTTDLQQDLCQHLPSPQYLVLVARSASELFIKAQHLQPALILLDSDFAITSTLQQLQTHLATQTIPIACLGVTVSGVTTTPVFHLSIPIQPAQLAQIWQELTLTSEPPPLPQPSRLPTPNLTILGAGNSPRNTLPKPSSKANLTVLRLGNHSRIHLQQCRVLEADDLEQAELLSLIWQPDVLLWDWNSPDSLTALLSLSRHQRLCSLPLVTLDVATTRAAAQLPRLQIFPCLVAETLTTASPEQASQTLSQVLQVAASYRETGA